MAFSRVLFIDTFAIDELDARGGMPGRGSRRPDVHQVATQHAHHATSRPTPLGQRLPKRRFPSSLQGRPASAAITSRHRGSNALGPRQASPRHDERSARRINADHLEVTIGEQQSECPCPASNVQHPVGAELARNPYVHIKITAVGIERVIGGDKARVLEDVVDHSSPILCHSARTADMHHRPEGYSISAPTWPNQRTP